MLKRNLLSLLLLCVTIISGKAQEIHYPAEVKALFEKADAEVSEYYKVGKILRFAQNDNIAQNDNEGLFLAKPRIAVPECEVADLIKDMIRTGGGEPIDMPSNGSSAIDLRLSASDWDGAAMPDGWVNTSDEYSVLVYKTITDWNIPYLGTSNLTKTIDKGLMRLPCDIQTYEALVNKAKTYRKARNVMEGLFSIDTHCDLPEEYSNGWSVGKRCESQSGVPKMDEGNLDSQVLISFLWQGPRDEASSQKAVEKNLAQIAQIKEDIAKFPEICAQARTPDEALRLKEQGKKAFFIALENGYGLGKDIGNIKRMKELGIIYISLSHFKDNDICNTSSRQGSDPSKGLTEFGKKVIEEMNRQGIMIDLSHPSAGTFWDCIELSKAPVICSHSGAKAIYGHDRGLDDKQLKALAEKGGVIQVYTVPEFLTRQKESSSIGDFMRHFDHCVEVAGPEHVGIGSDFDGGGGVWGCNGDNDLINITVKMIERGYSTEQIKGFWGGNFLRVMGEAQAIADRD